MTAESFNHVARRRVGAHETSSVDGTTRQTNGWKWQAAANLPCARTTQARTMPQLEHHTFAMS